VALGSGSNLVGHGAVNARISGTAGSQIAADGPLNLGVASPAAFGFDGELQTGANTVTITSGTVAGLGNLTVLGNDDGPGTIQVTNGFTIDFDQAIAGYGTIDSTNALAKRATINGSVLGKSDSQKITLTGYIKGTGTFDNVTFAGTYSPGLSPVRADVGSIAFAPASNLQIELAGTERGSQYDAIVASGSLDLNGSLVVSLLDSYTPAWGSVFDILDWGARTGSFASIVLPSLTGALQWNTSKLYSDGVLSVMLAGDYDGNRAVDMADFVWWRKFDGSTSGYNAWRSHFGATVGGAGPL
jgi:hypothetical protein